MIHKIKDIKSKTKISPPGRIDVKTIIKRTASAPNENITKKDFLSSIISSVKPLPRFVFNIYFIFIFILISCLFFQVLDDLVAHLFGSEEYSALVHDVAGSEAVV